MTQIQKLKGSHECCTLVNVTSLVNEWKSRGYSLTTPIEKLETNEKRTLFSREPIGARVKITFPWVSFNMWKHVFPSWLMIRRNNFVFSFFFSSTDFGVFCKSQIFLFGINTKDLQDHKVPEIILHFFLQLLL